MKWPGGLIRKTPVTPAGPLQNGAAPGMWTLADAAYWTKQGLWPIAGNFLAVEDVFSTYLYTGNGSTQTITNGINVSGSGGLVWTKSRNDGGYWHSLCDTTRGAGNIISTNATNGQFSQPDNITGFTSTGFSVGSTFSNTSGYTFASWTFREAPNFFDVVTWTGNGANRNIAHNLGSVPGMIIVKRTDTAADWQVYHRSNANTQYQVLNTTAGVATGTTRWNSTTPTATEFTVGTDATVNASGGTYVAYLYAHDTSSTGLIQCGTYTGNGNTSVQNINLGWEPQWILIKQSVVAGGAAGYSDAWQIVDNMRGLVVGADDAILNPNSSSAENTNTFAMAAEPTATGWQVGSQNNYSGATYIYMAIRRGPMRTPTLGTSVFAPVAFGTGTPANTKVTTNFPVDLVINTIRSGDAKEVLTRLTASNTSGSSIGLRTNTADAETNRSPSRGYGWDSNVSLTLGGYYTDFGGNSNIQWNFRRAPGFMDVVFYTGNGVAGRTVPHNLGVAPEMMIFKTTGNGNNWCVYNANLGASAMMRLNATDASNSPHPFINYTSPTSTVFTVGGDFNTNHTGLGQIAYLFASCPGVSKVGSYTGNGSSQTINCAFTTGARYVLIKRTDSTGNWLVWDSARGIVAGNDPYLALNNTDAEVTTNDSVDTDSTGFIVNQVAASNVNVNAATYIFLAIA
jgi:hypothetical protein